MRINLHPSLRIIIAWFGAEALVGLYLWLTTFTFLPTPIQIWNSFQSLSNQGLQQGLETSFLLYLKALFLSSLISLPLGYLSKLVAFKPITAFITKLRFLSLVGISYIAMMLTGGGYAMKLWLLVFAILVFQLTGNIAVVESVPDSEFDYSRTLRLPDWRVMWETLVLGTLPEIFDVFRQCAAMGWMMLTAVEGLVRSEGGIGVLLLNQQKYFKVPEMIAIGILLVGIGFLQDYVIKYTSRTLFHYAETN